MTVGSLIGRACVDDAREQTRNAREAQEPCSHTIRTPAPVSVNGGGTPLSQALRPLRSPVSTLSRSLRTVHRSCRSRRWADYHPHRRQSPLSSHVSPHPTQRAPWNTAAGTQVEGQRFLTHQRMSTQPVSGRSQSPPMLPPRSQTQTTRVAERQTLVCSKQHCAALDSSGRAQASTRRAGRAWAEAITNILTQHSLKAQATATRGRACADDAREQTRNAREAQEPCSHTVRTPSLVWGTPEGREPSRSVRPASTRSAQSLRARHWSCQSRRCSSSRPHPTPRQQALGRVLAHPSRPAPLNTGGRAPRQGQLGRSDRRAPIPRAAPRYSRATPPRPRRSLPGTSRAARRRPIASSGQSCAGQNSPALAQVSTPLPALSCGHRTFEPLRGKETVEVLGWQKRVLAVCG